MATRQIPWARIVAEGVAIVSSILLAFGIQAWWSGRQDRTSEVTYLESLLRDLQTDSVEYSAVETVLQRAQSYTEQTLALLAAHTDSGDTPAALAIYCASFLPIPVITRGTMQDLLSTGALQLLRNRELRSALLRYHEKADSELQWVDEYRASQQHYRELLADLRLPELQAQVGGIDRTTDVQSAQLAGELAETPGAVAALNRMLFAQQRMLLHVGRLTAESRLLMPRLADELMLTAGRGPGVSATESASSYMIDSGTCPDPVSENRDR